MDPPPPHTPTPTRILSSGRHDGGVAPEWIALLPTHPLPRASSHQGGMMEEWHQKLHNNTSPDDVVICQVGCLPWARPSPFTLTTYFITDHVVSCHPGSHRNARGGPRHPCILEDAQCEGGGVPSLCIRPYWRTLNVRGRGGGRRT